MENDPTDSVREWRVEGLFANPPLEHTWITIDDQNYGVIWPTKLETAVEVWSLLKEAGFDGGLFRLVNVNTEEVILCTVL